MPRTAQERELLALTDSLPRLLFWIYPSGGGEMSEETLTFNLTVAERDFLLEAVGPYLDDELIQLLRIAELKGEDLAISMTDADIDYLLGFIAAEANHAEDEEYEEQLDAIYNRIQRMTGV